MYYYENTMGKRESPKKSDVLSASEIGQYVFCSCAWQLRRLGYEPESPFLEPGKDAHVALGEQMERFERTLRISRWCALIGVAVLCGALLLFFFGVML
jgi:hypothetical protein